MKLLKLYLARKTPLLACFAALVLPELALACMCSRAPNAMSSADFVFTGYLSAEPRVNTYGGVVFTFDQLDILKGSFRSIVEITSAYANGSSCGYRFFPEVKYRVYASKRSGVLTAGLCSVDIVQ